MNQRLAKDTGRPSPYLVASGLSISIALLYPVTMFLSLMGGHLPTAQESRYDIFGGFGIVLAGCVLTPIVAVASAAGALAGTAVGISQLRKLRPRVYPVVTLIACGPAFFIGASFFVARYISQLRRPEDLMRNPAPDWRFNLALASHIALAATAAAIGGSLRASRMSAAALASLPTRTPLAMALAIILCGAGGNYALLLLRNFPAAVISAVLGFALGWVLGSHIAVSLEQRSP